MKDRHEGWFGLALGAVFIALSVPGLLALFAGRPPYITVKSVQFSGEDALTISFIAAASGAVFVGIGLRRLIGSRK